MGIRTSMLRGWRVILWLGPAALLLSAALSYWYAQRALARDLDDEALGQSAQRIARAADVYMGRVVNGIADIAAMPQLRAAAAAGNSRGALVETDFTLDKYWENTNPGNPGQPVAGIDPALDQRINAILESETSRFFQNLVKTPETVLKEFALTDRYGRLVAASVRTDDYLQHNDRWWPANLEGFRSCSASPAECALYRDVRWDVSANAFGMDVTLPIRDGEALAGVLKVVVDPLELDAIAALSDATVSVMLRRRDGRTLLERDKRTMFDGGNVDTPGKETRRVQELIRGGETILRRTDGNVVVRALRGPMGSYWIAAARPAVTSNEKTWLVPAVWLLLTVVALLVTAFAAAAGRTDGQPVAANAHAEPL